MSNPVHWVSPPPIVNLREDELHLWCVSLDQEAVSVERFRGMLAEQEEAQADRYRFPRDRSRFIVGRGVLRELLGLYLKRPPESLLILKGPHDKPFLPDHPEEEPLRFNLSHSHGLAVYALLKGAEVGIDIERIQPDFASNEIAERYFSLQERAALRALAPEARAEAFFLCWTRKEAYMKARGEGLEIPLGSFSVSLHPAEPAVLECADRERWTLETFCPAPGFAGAVVVGGRQRKMRFWKWQSPGQTE